MRKFPTHRKKHLDWEEVSLMLQSGEWENLVSRPLSLFVISIIDHCYRKYIPLITDNECAVYDGIFVQLNNGVVENHRKSTQLNEIKLEILDLYQNDKNKILSLLNQAEKFNRLCEDYVSGKVYFKDIDEMVDAICRLFIVGGMLPHFLLILNSEGVQIDSNIVLRSEALRGVTYHPKIITNILMPQVVKILDSNNIDNSKEVSGLILYQELIDGIFENGTDRLLEKHGGNQFVYCVFNGKIDILWRQEITSVENRKTLSGRTAFSGIATGLARVVLTLDGSDISDFNKGDILVSINSSPNLLHLIKKAGGIVTDEGGPTCHAAIVSREFKIPCIMSTKEATKVIQTGDLVEVDANKGIVKILKRAQVSPQQKAKN